jgi:hypothetical protein
MDAVEKGAGPVEGAGSAYGVWVGLGRILALYYSASTLSQIHERIRYLYF